MKKIQEDKEKALAALAIQYQTQDALQGPFAAIAIICLCMVAGTVVLIDSVKLYRLMKWVYAKLKARRQARRQVVPEIRIEMVNTRKTEQIEDEDSKDFLERKRKREELNLLEVQFYTTFLAVKQRKAPRNPVTFKIPPKKNRIGILKRK